MSYTIVSVCESARNTYVHSKSYEDKAIRLARSIRKLDSKVPIVMWYADDKKPSDSTISQLKDFDCRVIEGKCLYPDHPLFNKIEGMVNFDVDTDHRLWIDSDIYVRGGLEYFDTLTADVATSSDMYSFHALTKLEDYPIWETYFAHFGIKKLRQYSSTSLDNGLGNFYMNTGTIWLKNDPVLLKQYKSYAQQLLESDLAYSKEYYDAVGLTLTVLQSSCTYDVLPESYNYYYGLHKDVNGKFIHYQGNDLSGHEEIDW